MREDLLKNPFCQFAGVSEYALVLENVPEVAPWLLQFDLMQIHRMVFVLIRLTNNVVVDEFVDDFDFVSLTTV
jgi:hypothetical protein